MLTPRYLSGLSDELVDIYSQLETDILQDMARRIARLGKITEATRWQAQMLAEVGGLQSHITRTLKTYDAKTVTAVKSVYTEALQKSAATDNRIFSEAIGRTVSAPNAQQMLATIQKCHSDLSLLTLTTAATSQQQFVQQANRVYMDVQSGAFDYDTAMKSAANELSKRGITTVQYENGKPVTRTIESAVRMNILTSINQTAANMTLNNCEELDCDLVETSAHIGARPEHEEWQGQIFSISGTSKKYRPFSVCELGSPTGICGINCRHSYYPYFEGMEKHYTQDDLDEMANDKVSYNGKEITRYEGEQHLRKVERNIRRYKREALTQEAAGVDNTKARHKIGEWQAAARDFTKQTGISRDSAREYVGTATGKQPTALKPKKNTTVTAETIKTDYKAVLKKYNGNETQAVTKATKAEAEIIKLYRQTENTESLNENYIKSFENQTVDYKGLSNALQTSTTQAERDALNLWSGSSYRQINDYMRNGAKVDAIYIDAAQKMHDGLNKCKYPAMYVRRGARYGYLDSLMGGQEWRKNPAMLLGQDLRDNGFLATTPSKAGGFSGEVMIYYKVPNNAKAAYIDNISRNKGELETLFIDHTTATVREIRTEQIRGHTRYVIIADII